MIEIYLLEQFVAIDKEGSLSKAAESLYLSQPALSRSMKKLEAELGVNLFDRDKGRMTLNEVGKKAVVYAKDLLNLDENIEKDIRSYARSLRTFSYASCAPLPVYTLSGPLTAFYGGMSISSLVTNDTDEELIHKLRDRTYQMVVTHSKSNEKDLTEQFYSHEKILVSVGKKSPLAKHKSLTFDMLKDTPIVVHEHIGFWLDVVRKHLPERNLMIQPQLSSLEQLLISTDLPVFYSSFRQGQEREGRVTLPFDEPEMEASYYLVCLNQDRDTMAPFFSFVRGQTLQSKEEFFQG